MAYVIGVDVGGTFTDAVLDDDAGHGRRGEVAVDAAGLLARACSTCSSCSPSSSARPLPEMLADTHHIAHGTTSSLNALVTGNVPAVGFLTTKGHRDSIFIMNVEGRYLGRSPHELQHVLGQDKQPPPAARSGTRWRSPSGSTATATSSSRSTRTRRARAIRALLADGVRAIAVSLLWSFRNPAHERRLRELVARDRPGRVRRAVERGQPADPGVRPQRHDDHEHADRPRPARLPRPRWKPRCANASWPDRCSSCRATAARSPRTRRPPPAISTVGSVLTGGVVGSVALGRQLGHRNIISTDVGGTTFLVGLVVDGEPVRDTTTVINHHPINVPTLRVDAIGSGGGAIAWLDAGRQPADRPAQRAGRPRPRLLRPGRHRADQHRRQPGARHPPRARACSAGASRCRSSSPARPSTPRSPSRSACPSRTPRRRSTPCRTRRPATCCARPSSRPATTPATSCSTPSAAPGPAHCAALRRRGRRRRRSSSRSGRWRRRSRPTGSRRRTSCWPPSSRTPTFVPFDPARAERNFAAARGAGARRARPPRPDVRHRRDRTARSTCATRCSSPRSRRRSRGGPLDAAAIEAAATRVRDSATPSSTAQGAGFREAGIQAITYRVRGIGVLPFIPGAARDARRPTPRTRPPPQIGTGPCTSTLARASSTPRSTTTRALRAGHVLTGPAIVEVPTTTVVVPAWHHRHRRPTSATSPSAPSARSCVMTMPIPGSEMFSSRPIDPDKLARSLPLDAAGAHASPRSRSTRSTR